MNLEEAYEKLKGTGLLKSSAESWLKVYKTYKRFKPNARSNWDAILATSVKHGISEQHVARIVKKFNA